MNKDMKETKQKLTDAIEEVESALKKILEKMSDDDKKKYDDKEIEGAKRVVESAMKEGAASLVLIQNIDEGDHAKESLVAVRGTRIHVLAMLCTLVLEVIENVNTTPEEFAKVFLEGCKKCTEDK